MIAAELNYDIYDKELLAIVNFGGTISKIQSILFKYLLIIIIYSILQPQSSLAADKQDGLNTSLVLTSS
jgi:hypothetical protein